MQLAGVDRDQVQVIDIVPVPFCTLTRGGRRDRCFINCFINQADSGYCAAKKLHYYGFKLGLRVARCGMIVEFPLLAARPHDINHFETLVEGFEGIVPADKGFIDAWRQAALQQQQGVVVITPPRSNSKSASLHPKGLRRACAYWRKRVEIVGSQLTERFALDNIRVYDLWHFQHRLIRKVLVHTVAVFLNIKLGRPPLHLDDLVAH